MIETDLRRAGEFQVQTGAYPPVLLHVAVVKVRHHGEIRAPRKQRLASRVKAALGELVELPQVDALNEAEIGSESFAAVDVLEIIKVIAVLLVEIDVVGVAAGTGAVERSGLAGHSLRGKGPGGTEPQARIQCLDTVETAGELAVAQEQAGVGLRAELAEHVNHADVRAVSAGRIGGIQCGARGAIVDRQQAHAPAAQLAGEAAAELGVDDAAGKQERFRCHEVTVVLEKEGAFFRETNFEPLVDGHLRIVGFDLAEIGIERDIERERLVDYRFGVEAGASFGVALERGSAVGWVVEQV